MDDLKSRRGIITISQHLLFGGDIKLMKIFFGNFYPINAQWDDTHGFANDVTYIGISEHFDVVEEGCAAPEYTAEISHDSENDTYTIKFIK